MVENNAFPGDSEMARRMRQFDWGSTQLGVPQRWPQSLRTVVRVLLQSRHAMFIWWGRELIQLYNDAYIPMLGSRHPAALGRRGSEVWSDIWSVVGPQARDVMERGSSTWNERLLLVMQRHGYTEESYFTFSYSPAYDDGGAIGGVFCAVTEDTERVLGERRLAALAALASHTSGAESERQAGQRAVVALEAFGHDLPFVALFMGGGVGRPSLVAATATARHPITAGDVDWQAAQWPFGLAAKSGIEVVEELESVGCVVGAGPWPEPVRRAVVIRVASHESTGGNAFVVVGLSPRRPFDAEYRGFVELVAGQIGKALSDARQVEHERRRAAELAALDRAKTDFFSNMSHEFRTPLTLILASLEEAARRTASARAANEPIATARGNAQRLLRLVNTLLDFARIESGRVQARFCATNLASLTADLASNFRSACQRAGLRLEVDCRALDRAVFVDPQLWEKIVLNLLSNAFKFTHEGYIRVTVREATAVTTGAAVAELIVEDSGVGISRANLPRLFRRFERLEATGGRSYEGSGIGLSLVNELVSVHGGTIRVESELGKGSRFIVSLPFGLEHIPADAIVDLPHPEELGGFGAELYVAEALQWLQQDAEVSPASERDAGEPAPESTRVPVLRGGAAGGAAPGANPLHHILVVDDNADMRRYIQRILGRGHRVTLAYDGERAWQALASDLPDLVITDIMMPELDGFGLIARMRADERTRGVPVIALSARAGAESRIEGLKSGADAYLVKPFSAGELAAHVDAQLRLADAARDRARLLASEQAAREEAEAQRRQLRAIFDQAPSLIAVFRGPDHVVELANDRICRAWGRKRSDVLGRPFFDAVPEGSDQSWRALLDGVYDKGESYVGRETEAVFEREGRLEQSYYDFVWAPLREDNVVTGIIVVATDVTAQVVARRQLSELREDAEAANRAKDEFLAMLGHELRNPLAPITTALELLKLRGITEGERERAIIERQVSHLVTLVDDLLDVSRITRGKVELKRVFVEVADVVAKAIEMASPLLEQQRHELRVDVPESGMMLLADPGRLAQVLSNILTNAAKYTERGGLVDVSAAHEGDEVVLRVRDTGVGIAPEMLPHIFDLFAQERQTLARSRGGLGLGLTIARSLVGLHGGTITADSAGSGCGATFTVRLPQAESSGMDETAPSSQLMRTRAGAMVDLRVLVVDDNVDAADMLVELLPHFGCVVRAVHDGPAALEAAATFRPDVALVDIGLPVMDGYEVARRLVQGPGLAELRLVAVTGYGQQKDRERSAAAGFHAHLVKPLDLSQLRDILLQLSKPVA